MRDINPNNCPFEPYIQTPHRKMRIIGELSDKEPEPTTKLTVGVWNMSYAGEPEDHRIQLEMIASGYQFLSCMQPKNAELLIQWLQEAINTVKGE
jgi:hypothetical protein